VRAVPTGARMQISAEQGQLMGLLVEATGAQRAIEVGTFTGYSSIVIAQVRPAHQICGLYPPAGGIAPWLIGRFWPNCLRPEDGTASVFSWSDACAQ